MNRSRSGYSPPPNLGKPLSTHISKAARCSQKLIQMFDGDYLKIVLSNWAGMA